MADEQLSEIHYSTVVSINIIIGATHGFFIIALLCIELCMVTKCRCSRKTANGESQKIFRVSFTGHKIRWMIILLLFFLLMLKLLEGVLNTIRSESLDFDVHIVNLLALLSCVIMSIFYHFSECRREIRLLSALFIYSFITFSLAVVSCVGQYSGIFAEKITEVRFMLSCLISTTYGLLWLLDIFILLKKRYLTRRVTFKAPVDDLNSVKYVPSYTHLLSRLGFVWLSPLLSIGHRRKVHIDDLGTIPHEEESRYNFERLKAEFENEKKVSYLQNRDASLWRCLWRLTRSRMLLSGLFKIIGDVLMYVPPLCLTVIVNSIMLHVNPSSPANAPYSINTSSTTVNFTSASQSIAETGAMSVSDYFRNAYVIGFVCFVVLLLHFILAQQSLFISMREGIRCKAAIQALVFDKSLRLMTSSVDEGRVMNHMTIDPLHVVFFFYLCHFLWTLPITIALGLVLLYVQLGKSALICGVMILFMVPLQYFSGRRLAFTQKLILEKADKRLKQSNELLQNIKLLKLYAWEYIFHNRITATRKKELKLMLKASIYRLLSATVTDGMPFWACAVTFAIYINIETEPLHPGKVFSVMSLFQLFANQLFITTLVINTTAQAMISVSRLQQFLLMTEVQHRNIIPPNDAAQSDSDEMSDILSNHNGIDQDGKLNHLISDKNDHAAVYIVSNGKSDATEMQPLTHTNEKAPYTQNSESSINLLQPDPRNVLEIRDGKYGWIEGQQTLFDVNIFIPKGRLTVVVGPVGSGKSSLLSAIVGEMRIISERPAYSTTRFAVVPQKSWILNATIQENITLGSSLDEEKYRTVISASGLKQDLEQFPDRDLTEIGEKGANLSGGQRQRISIARALYSDQDIYLMDDALSALDAQVGSHVFEQAIKKYLVERQKSVVLVTHHLHLISKAHHLIVMKHGRVVYQGAPDGLDTQVQHSLTKKLIPKLNRQTSNVSDVEHSDWLSPDDAAGAGQQTNHTSKKASSLQCLYESTSVLYHSPGSLHTDLRFSQASVFSLDEALSEEIISERALSNEGGDKAEAGRLIQEEEVMTGRVTFKYYLAYLRAATWLLVSLAVMSYVVKQGLRMFADYLLNLLVDVTARVSYMNDEIGNVTSTDVEAEIAESMKYYVIRYSIVCVVCILLVATGMLFLELSVLTASKNLHHNLIKSVVSAPMRFFDTTPIGRILNRLSADLCTIDEKMIGAFDAVLFCSLVAISGIVMNAVFVPYFIIPVVPLLIIYFIIQRYYIATCRELQRLDCVTKSPVLAHFSQALDGLAAIRTYRLQGKFQKENWKKLDTNNITFLFFHASNSWVGVRMDSIGTCIVLVACVASTTSGLMGVIAPGTVGLVIGYAIVMCEFINWTMRGLSEVEMYFNNVQRIVEYSEIPSEPSHIGKELIPPASWPERGEIILEDVSLRYSPDMEPVVRHFSLHIKPGQKVGICGRTGSGKSSLTLSLFRLVDISEGRILLDGVDINRIPLELLRSRLSIIPQEPILFTGTIRFNLDPLQQKSDADIWRHLKASQLSLIIESLPDRLDTEIVSEGGDKFSIGQKQLICLARALLRESQVLVMDEATASVDVETDHLIQEIVKREFAGRTVITIAHRLSTIQNCDHIVVMQDGEKMEEGSPAALAEQSGGIFARMLAENKL